MIKKIFSVSLVLLFLPAAVSFAGTGSPALSELSAASKQCLSCHKKQSPGIYGQWLDSRHAAHKIGCYECHGTEKDDKDGMRHMDTYISVIVSPSDCKKCHPGEVEQFSNSAHAAAADRVMVNEEGILMADYVAGNREFKTQGFPRGVSAAGVNGCWKCHGYKVKVDESGKLDPATWPNTGMGRINPDGSKGNCAACHMGHGFSAAQARRPESCSGCHTGSSSHYIFAIYRESRHGISYYTNKNKMNLDAPVWIAGKNYTAAPTCATCHMAAAVKINRATHNVDQRILITEPGKEKSEIINDNMKQVCMTCHSENFVGNFKRQYEGEYTLYSGKWMNPGKKLFCLAREILEAVQGKGYRPLRNPIDYTWMSIGDSASQARIATAMMGQFYVDQANLAFPETWFTGFVPRLKEIIILGKQHEVPAAKKLEECLEKILSNPIYGPGWPNTDIFGCEGAKQGDE